MSQDREDYRVGSSATIITTRASPDEQTGRCFTLEGIHILSPNCPGIVDKDLLPAAPFMSFHNMLWCLPEDKVKE